MCTYPNKEHGISKEDIIDRFKNDDTKEGRERIEKHKSRYLNPKIHTWVAKDDEEIVGMCIATNEEGNHRIYEIYILPEYQKQGIGSQMVKKALGWIGATENIYVNVVSYNDQAIKFYEKFGFTKSGRKVKESIRPFSSGVSIPEIELVRYL